VEEGWCDGPYAVVLLDLASVERVEDG